MKFVWNIKKLFFRNGRWYQNNGFIKLYSAFLTHLVFSEEVLKSIPLPLAPNVNLLCRELVDLLKTTEKCQILLSKFIPAYHHHFGRQCRVADYGYTKLLDLFESIPHVAQVRNTAINLIHRKVVYLLALQINVNKYGCASRMHFSFGEMNLTWRKLSS